MKKNKIIYSSIILFFIIILILILQTHKVSKTCDLPCIFGLNPNEISKDETIDYFISKKFEIYSPEPLDDDKLKIDVVNELSDETIEIQLKFKDNIFTDYFFYTNNQSVKLSIYDLLSRYGKPTKILINYRPQEANYWITYIYILYENNKFGVTYSSPRGVATLEGIYFCFDDYPLIYNFNNLEEQDENMKARALNKPMKSIELVTDYDLNTFYDFVLNSNQYCIDIYPK